MELSRVLIRPSWCRNRCTQIYVTFIYAIS